MHNDWLERRNAENWIHSNRGLASCMLKRRSSVELHKYGRERLNLNSVQITKRLNAALGFGVIDIFGNPPGHYCELSEMGKELYEEIKKQDKG